MLRVCGRTLVVALMVSWLLPASPCGAQKAGKKREQFWDPAGGAPAIIRRAQHEYERENYERALMLYKEALETVPEQYLLGLGAANIHFEIGTCYTKLHRYDEAIAAIQKSNSYYPESDFLATHCAWLGMIYSRMEDYSKAEHYWQKATELDPRQSVYYAGLANNSVRLGHYDRAQEAIDQGRRVAVTAEAPDDFKEAQIIVYLAKGNYAEAHRLTGNVNLLGAYLLDTQPRAILVNYVFQGGPAQLAGLAAGDIVESFNGKPVKNVDDFFNALAAVPFASAVVIRIKRNLDSQDKYVIAGVPPNLPELAAAAKAKAPPSACIPAPPTHRPSIQLRQVRIRLPIAPLGAPYPAVELAPQYPVDPRKQHCPVPGTSACRSDLFATGTALAMANLTFSRPATDAHQSSLPSTC